MSLLPGRIAALIRKELLTLFRDPKTRLVLIGPPLVQLFIFSFAATLEVNNVSLAVCNQDMGKHGHEIVRRFAASPTFTKIRFLSGVSEFAPTIDEQRSMAILHIPQDFSRDIEAGVQARLQLLLDGRRSQAAQIVSGYSAQIIAAYSAEAQADSSPAPAFLVERNWFNENLIYLWFTVPSLIAVLAMLITLMVTSLSVAREKELGTFDQLLVSPLMPMEILLGKTIPAILVGIMEALLILSVSIFVFRIPFRGSLSLLLLAVLVFVLSLVGLGLFISSLAKTQQQAILGAFVLMVPSITLSGFAAPVENMPGWLQGATWINPIKHGLILVKGICLKDMPLAEAWTHMWPLLAIGVASLVLASRLFSRRLE